MTQEKERKPIIMGCNGRTVQQCITDLGLGSCNCAKHNHGETDIYGVPLTPSKESEPQLRTREQIEEVMEELSKTNYMEIEKKWIIKLR